MIYLDNAATTMKKPRCVIDAVLSAMQSMGNAGRGAHEATLKTSRTVYEARCLLAEFFNAEDPQQVVFTCNSTEALNIAIKGVLNPGDHVITTMLEHNSVLRPLYEMEKKGISLSFVKADREGNPDYAEFESLIRPETRAIITTHGSNLTGNVVDIARVGQIAKRHGLLFIVDASQTAGVFPIDVQEMSIDILCFTGHKSLLGPQGTGGMVVRKGLAVRPLKSGGSGVQTYRKEHPPEMPTALEAGTLNGHGIAGLAAAVEYIRETGIDSIREREMMLMRLKYPEDLSPEERANALVYYREYLEDAGELTEPDPAALRDEDKWMLSRLNDAVRYVTETMEKYDLALAGQRVYDLIWNEYCDWYIELVKKRLYGEDEADKQVARYVLVSVLKQMLTLLHPFMPFITEEIWGYLPGGDPESMDPDDFLIHGTWPEYDEALTFPEEAQILQMAMEIIRSIRNIRAEAEAAPGKKLHGLILPGAGKEEICRAAGPYISNLANLSDLQYIGDKSQVPEEVMSAVVDGAEIFVPLDDLMDYEAELSRLQKEKKRLEGEVKRVVGKLNNQGFVSKAPEKVVAEERAKKDKYEEMLAKVTDRLALVDRKLEKGGQAPSETLHQRLY